MEHMAARCPRAAGAQWITIDGPQPVFHVLHLKRLIIPSDVPTDPEYKAPFEGNGSQRRITLARENNNVSMKRGVVNGGYSDRPTKQATEIGVNYSATR